MQLEKENTKDSLKCCNLEHIIDAEQQGKDTPDELRLEDLLNEEARRDADNAEDAEAKDEGTLID